MGRDGAGGGGPGGFERARTVRGREGCRRGRRGGGKEQKFGTQVGSDPIPIVQIFKIGSLRLSCRDRGEGAAAAPWSGRPGRSSTNAMHKALLSLPRSTLAAFKAALWHGSGSGGGGGGGGSAA